MSSPLHEQTTLIEPLSEDVFLNLLAGVANHEAKLLTTAVIASQPDRWFSRAALHDEMLRIQGDEVVWEMDERLPGNYCDYSLSPVGAVVVDDIEGKRGMVHSFRASKLGQEYGLALAGSLLDWSLANPNVSLQRILGATGSRTEVRAPEVRWRILSELLTAPDDEVSFADIHDSINLDGYDLGNIGNHIRNLESNGLIEVRSTLDEYNPIFRITSPVYNHLSRPLEETSEANQAIYQALNNLYAEGTTELSLDQIIEECTRHNPGVRIQPIYFRLVKATNEFQAGIPGLEITDRNGAPVKRTSVKLQPEFTGALTDLLERLDQLQDPKNVARLQGRAKDILQNPEACRSLLSKAQRFSNTYKGAVEGGIANQERIKELIGSLGSLATKDIKLALAKNGTILSTTRMQHILSNMVGVGQLTVEKEQRELTRKQKLTSFHYQRIASYSSYRYLPNICSQSQ